MKLFSPNSQPKVGVTYSPHRCTPCGVRLMSFVFLKGWLSGTGVVIHRIVKSHYWWRFIAVGLGPIGNGCATKTCRHVKLLDALLIKTENEEVAELLRCLIYSQYSGQLFTGLTMSFLCDFKCSSSLNRSATLAVLRISDPE